MEAYYEVTLNGTPCGKVSVHRQGLYYRFSCKCVLDKNDIYRLILSCGDFQKSLGVLAPYETGFEIVTRIPVKQIREGDWLFHVIPKHTISAENFVPIHPEEPFAYLSRLKDSFLIYQDGQPGIYAEKMQE